MQQSVHLPLVCMLTLCCCPQVYLPIGWSTYFFSAARVTFNTSEVERAQQQVRIKSPFPVPRPHSNSAKDKAGHARID